ncbi:hypothetical protein Tco_1193242 [Tanacetum coccineum]
MSLTSTITPCVCVCVRHLAVMAVGGDGGDGGGCITPKICDSGKVSNSRPPRIRHGIRPFDMILRSSRFHEMRTLDSYRVHPYLENWDAALLQPFDLSGITRGLNSALDLDDLLVTNDFGSGYQQKDRKPSQNDKTEHGMEKTVQNQGQSPKMSKSAVKPEPELKNTIGCNLNPSDGPGKPNSIFMKTVKTKWALNQLQQPICVQLTKTVKTLKAQS